MDKKNLLYNIAIFQMCLLTGIVAITSVFLLLGISIGWMNFLLPLLLCVWYFITKVKDNKEKKYICIISICIFIISILFAGCFFDKTWDGAAYHKQAIGLLKEGWNPVYFSSSNYNDMIGSIKGGGPNPLYWSEAYPKSTWYFASTVYFMTGNIEMGKAYSILFMFITFGLVYDWLLEFKVKSFYRVILALLLTLNPIALAQFGTYYIDGVATSVLLLLILYLPTLFQSEYHRSIHDRFIIVGSLIVWGCNLKFSILFFTGTYCILAFIYTWYKEKRFPVKLFTFFSMDAVFSIMVVGFAPYITNVIRYKNPFYGFLGKDTWLNAERIVEEFGIDGCNNLERFIYSLFGKMSHGEYHSVGELLKVPLTFSNNEIKYYSIPDTRVGGFGIFFSGILVISIIIIIYMCVVNKKRIQINSTYLFFIGLLIIVSVCEMVILPGTYSARYVGQLYFIPFWALFLLQVISKDSDKKYKRIIPMALIFLCLCNIWDWILLVPQKIKVGIQINAELQKVANEGQEIDVAFHAFDFNGLQYNLKDYNIQFDVKMLEELDDDIYSTYGNWILYNVKK